MTKLKGRMRSLNWEIKLLILFGFISVLPLFLTFWQEPKLANGAEPSIDTHIPRGYVLVPIEIENYEAVDSILGRFGIVDLFLGGEIKSNTHPIAVNVRLLRAPRNPSHFAVLVPDTEADKILSHGSSFRVTVKRPDESGMKFVNPQATQRRKIVYGGD